MHLRDSRMQRSDLVEPHRTRSAAAHVALCAVAIIPVLLSGCGSGNSLDLAPVTGKVTFQGEPLDHGTVIFFPPGGTKGPQASGMIQPDGSFTMKTSSKAGAVVGKHKVMVQCRRVVTPEEAKYLVMGELLIPRQYANPNSTPLQIDVEKGGNEFPIELK